MRFPISAVPCGLDFPIAASSFEGGPMAPPKCPNLETNLGGAKAGEDKLKATKTPRNRAYTI
jgi:hypothetical protein